MTLVELASNVRPMRARHASGVRPFLASDIPRVADVHRAVFGVDGRASLEDYADYFTRLFLSPAADRRISSLVYQEADGRVSGFLGLVPRRVTLSGRQYQAAISSQFIVDPASRVALVALRLVKAYLEGPQDLSIADEANDVSRRIWEGLGGTAALLPTMYWTRALRPARFALSFLSERRATAPLAVAAGPIASFVDGIAVRTPRSPFRQSEPAAAGEPLTAPAALSYLAEACGDATLRAEYDEATFDALIDNAGRRADRGRVLNAIVKNGSAVAGWYIAHVECNGVAEVAQIAATPSTIDAVLDHLFYRARRHGAWSASGRLHPRFLQALSDKYCVFHRRGRWVLINTTKPELRHAIEAGNTCLSRFDGEWSLRFHPRHA
jgi:hypothetical protein